MWVARASLYDADRKTENRSDGEAMSKDNVVVGFVGLGTMGGRMAANVQRAGFKLVVHDLHRQAASHHLAAGAIWANSPRALAREADVIFSSLPEPSDVEAVALGGDGLIAGIKPGAAYFDLSTNSPSVVKKLNAAFALKGAHMLDAPMGRPRFALGDAAPTGTRGCQDRGGSRAVGRSARACHPRGPLGLT